MPNPDGTLTQAEKNAQFQLEHDAKVAARLPVPTTPTLPSMGGNISANGQGTGLNKPIVPPSVPAGTGTGVNTNVNTNIPTVPNPTSGNTVPTGSDMTPGDDGIWQYDELSAENRAILDADPLARDTFDLVGKQGQQTATEAVRKTMEMLTETRKRKDFDEEQYKNQLEQRNIQTGAAVRGMQTGVNSAKSNTYYSSFSSAPSTIANTAAGARIKEMTTQLDEFVRLNNLQNDAFAAQTGEQARRIQQDLEDKLGKTLTESLQNIDRAIESGTALTDDQLFKIYKDNRTAMQKAIPTLTNFAVQQLSDLTTNFMNSQKDIRDRQDLFNKGANTYNKEMSIATGFAVDGNGNPILDSKGNKIKIDPEAPLPPQFIKETGQIITYSKNANGTIIGTPSQVAGYIAPLPTDWVQRNNADGSTTIYSPSTKQTQFIPAPGQGNTSTTGGTYTPLAGFESRAAGQSIPITQTTNGIQIGFKNGQYMGECGTLPNDVYKGLPGYVPVTDTWKSKKDLSNSERPVVGGAVMWNPGGPYEANGHIGMVESVNADGSFQIADTNYVGKGIGSHRTIKPGSTEWQRIQNDGGFFDPGKLGASQGGGTYNSLPESDKGYVQSLAEYKADLPSKMNKNYTKYIAAAKEINPDFDQNNYSARKKFLGSWDGGNDSANIISINTTVGHLSTLLEAADGLGNDKVKVKNQFTNWAKDNLGDPSITNFDTAAHAVGSELAKAFKGGQASPTEDEIESWTEIFNKANSEEQLHAAVKQAAKLLSSRMKSLQNNYKRVMGDYPSESTLFPETIATLTKVGFDPNDFSGRAGSSETSTSTPTQTNNSNPYGI